MNEIVIFIKKLFTVGMHILHLNKLIYPLVNRNCYIQIDNEVVRKADNFLNKLDYNVKSSCITQNHIEPKVSVHIIVPAYNVERYIKECVDSIVKPAKRYSYHLTIINDGSTDGTGELLRDYENIGEVEIITQKNKGFSGARNAGLRHIVGEYVTFVDSDDYISWETLEKMLDCAFENDADAVEGSMLRVDDNKKKLGKEIVKEGKIGNALGKLHGHTCGKIIKSKYFEHICFPEKYWHQDSINAQMIFQNLDNCYGISDVMYYYRKHRGSITSVSEKSPKSIDTLWITLALYEDRKRLDMEKVQEYYEYLLNQAVLNYGRTQYQPKDVRKSIFVIYSHFIRIEFEDFHTGIEKRKELEIALKTGNYGKYEAYCKWK